MNLYRVFMLCWPCSGCITDIKTSVLFMMGIPVTRLMKNPHSAGRLAYEGHSPEYRIGAQTQVQQPPKPRAPDTLHSKQTGHCFPAL